MRTNFTVSLDPKFAEYITNYAKSIGEPRSKLIFDALEFYIKHRKNSIN